MSPSDWQFCMDSPSNYPNMLSTRGFHSQPSASPVFFPGANHWVPALSWRFGASKFKTQRTHKKKRKASTNLQPTSRRTVDHLHAIYLHLSTMFYFSVGISAAPSAQTPPLLRMGRVRWGHSEFPELSSTRALIYSGRRLCERPDDSGVAPGGSAPPFRIHGRFWSNRSISMRAQHLDTCKGIIVPQNPETHKNLDYVTLYMTITYL